MEINCWKKGKKSERKKLTNNYWIQADLLLEKIILKRFLE